MRPVRRERLGSPLTVGDLVLVPVERIAVDEALVGNRRLVFASKRPVAIVVRSGDREWRIELPDTER